MTNLFAPQPDPEFDEKSRDFDQEPEETLTFDEQKKRRGLAAIAGIRDLLRAEKPQAEERSA